MSAPLVVNTRDGACWTRRTVTEGGIALYALADVCTCPEFVMATLAELAERGIVGSADVLPMPVGPEPQAPMTLKAARVRLAQYGERTSTWSTATYDSGTERALHEIAQTLLAEVNRLEAERHSTNEALDDAVQALRSRSNFFQPGHTYAARAGWPGGRERFRFICESVTTDPDSGEPRALGQHGRLRTADGEWIWTPNPRTYDDWRGGAWTDITDELATPSVEMSADKLTQLLAPTQALQSEGEHYASVHHNYRVGRDLPETGGAR